MRPFYALIVPLPKLPENVIRECPSATLRTGDREFSPTPPPPFIFLTNQYHVFKISVSRAIHNFCIKIEIFHYFRIIKQVCRHYLMKCVL